VSGDESLVEEVVRESRWPRRSRRVRNIVLVLAVLLLVALLAVWTQRKPIARDFVAKELAKRGVSARYEITKIGFRTQRLEKLSIGDPRRPDLTADWAEITTSIGLGTVKVTGVRASGVRLYGKLVNGIFSFGEIDKLLPAPTGKPFTLPDLALELRDARMRLDLPNGPIGLKLEGNGNLTGGFKGKLAAATPALSFGDCALSNATAWLDLSVTDRQPRVAGPVRATGFACTGAGLALAAPEAEVDARLNEALNSWNGSARLQLARATLGGNRLERVTGAVGFDGGRRGTRGGIDIDARRLVAGPAGGQALRLDGRYTLGKLRGAMLIALGGKASLEHVAIDRAMLGQLGGLGKMADGTPVAPLARALADAAQHAGRDSRVSADFAVEQKGAAGSLKIASLNVQSESGAGLALSGGTGIGIAWPWNGSVQVDGRISLGGGGFPEADIQLAQAAPGAAIRGTATLAPYAAGGARLALTPVRFDAAEDGRTRFATQVTLDGPLAGGRVTGLTLPVTGRLDGGGAFSINPACAPLSFRTLSLSGLNLGASRLALCPYGGKALVASDGKRTTGGARIAGARLAGRLGENPVLITAADAHYALGTSDLAANDVRLTLGPSDRQTRLAIARLDGRVANGGVAGRFAGTGGKLVNVPLILSDAAGDWTFRNGALRLAATLNVSDEQAAPRFSPLVSQDFTLALVNGAIAARGTLLEPKSRTPVTAVTIAHDLGKGTGGAVLDVPGIQFGERVQPDTLTPLALGVVANVEGLVKGRGAIAWTPAGVTSQGDFGTTDMNLAAAFGPVTGLTTELHFTDLLGLVTAPGQVVTIREINPGIPVTNGNIRYHLLANQQVRIEGGEWPFAAGQLVLDPTTLDMGAAKARTLTFRVIGLDAAAFLQTFDFQNINATGVFDGVLPMVFDEQGGRIVAGNLKVREGGGNLAYIGQVSLENLGTWGNFAFDSLRSLNYRTLDILLNGDLAGEMVTEIRFAGISQGAGTKSNFLTRKIAKLPIRFNVRIAAPFRQLIFSARSFYDPSVLVEQNLDALIQAQEGEAPQNVVQPIESEKQP